MKKTILVVLSVLIFSIGNLFSQNGAESVHRFSDTTNLNRYLSFSPTCLLEYEASFQLGYSYPTNKGKERVQHEIAYVFLNDAFSVNSNSRSYSGFRIRNNYRVYYKSFKFRERRNSLRKYWAFDLMYKYGKYTDKNRSIWMGQYSQIKDISTEKHIGALHFVTGSQKFCAI